MISVSLSWVAEQVNGQLIAQQKQDVIIEGVSTDTRPAHMCSRFYNCRDVMHLFARAPARAHGPAQ